MSAVYGVWQESDVVSIALFFVAPSQSVRRHGKIRNYDSIATGYNPREPGVGTISCRWQNRVVRSDTVFSCPHVGVRAIMKKGEGSKSLPSRSFSSS